jgi:hypothetical protein
VSLVSWQDRHRLLPAFPRASEGFSDDYRRSRRVELFCARTEQVSVVKQLRRFAFALTASNHEAPRDLVREAGSDIFEKSNAESPFASNRGLFMIQRYCG